MVFRTISPQNTQISAKTMGYDTFFGKLMHPNNSIRKHRIEVLYEKTRATRAARIDGRHRDNPKYDWGNMLFNLRILGDLLIRDGRHDEAKDAYNKLHTEIINNGSYSQPEWEREMKICRLYPDHYSYKAGWLLLKREFEGAAKVYAMQEAAYNDIDRERTFPPGKIATTTVNIYLMTAYDRMMSDWGAGQMSVIREIEDIARKRAEEAHANWEYARGRIRASNKQ